MAVLKDVEKSKSPAYGMLPDSLQDFTEGQADPLSPCARCLLKIGFLAFGLLFLFAPLNFIASILHFLVPRCSYVAPLEGWVGIWLLIAFTSRITLTLKTKRFYPAIKDPRFCLAAFLDFSIVGGNIIASTTIYRVFDSYEWEFRLVCSICSFFSMITTLLVWVIVGVILLLAAAINKQHLRHLCISELSGILAKCYEICDEELRHHFGGMSSVQLNTDQTET